MNNYFFILLLLAFLSCGDDFNESTTFNSQLVVTRALRELQDPYMERTFWKPDAEPYVVEKTETNSFVLPGEVKKETVPEDAIFKIRKSDWAKKLAASNAFYSAKVDSLIQLKQQALDTISPGTKVGTNALGIETLKKLTVRELIYYCLAYPAIWNDTETERLWKLDGAPRFYPFLPYKGSIHYLSSLQKAAIRNRKMDVAAELNAHFDTTDIVGVPVLDLIDDVRFWQMIPALCKKASFDKNPLCYTVLIHLMYRSDYRPYYHSKFYEKFHETMYGEPMKCSEKEAAQLKELAMAFYKKNHEPPI
ncbi:MAG TPA: hypothetical protein VK177_21270 [Flavobacteriales bacterium]|nr:hypothetical protein [Flavobacteriales bacterium]